MNRGAKAKWLLIGASPIPSMYPPRGPVEWAKPPCADTGARTWARHCLGASQWAGTRSDLHRPIIGREHEPFAFDFRGMCENADICQEKRIAGEQRLSLTSCELS